MLQFRLLFLLLLLPFSAFSQTPWVREVLALPAEKQELAIQEITDTLFLRDPDAAIAGVQELVEHYERQGDYKKQAGTLTRESQLWENNGKLEEALQANLDALALAEREKDKALLGSSLNNLGSLYFLMKEYEKAYDAWLKAYKAKEQQQDPQELAAVSNNLSSALMRLKRLEEAGAYLEKALQLYRSANDTAHYCSALLNYGLLYYRKTGKSDSSIYYLEETYRLARLSGSRAQQAQAALNIGFFEASAENWRGAIQWFLEAEKTSRELKEFAILRQSLGNLAESYEATRQFEEAYYYFRAYSSLNDSLNTAEAQTKIAEMEQRFEVARKDKTIAEQDIALARSENRTLILVFVALVLGIALFLILFYFRQKRKLGEKLEAEKTALYVNMVHEFRTPLSLVLATMEERLRRDREIRSSDEMAYRNALQLNLMIDQLLDIARTGKWSQETVLKTGEVLAMLRDMLDFFRVLAHKKNIQLVFEPRLQPVVKSLDADKLGKILFNLIGNALKYTPAGGEVRLVIFPLVDKNGQAFLSLEISDTGIGIPEADQQQLGKRFFRAENGRNAGGTGIGLSLSLDLAAAANGKLSWSSEAGKGSVFRLEIPVYDPVAKPEEEPKAWVQHYLELFSGETVSAGQEHQPEEIPEKQQLVLVEDDPEMRHETSRMMERAGYQVSAFGNAEEAFEFTCENLPDVVISDVVLPGMHGIELCRLIKETPLTAHIPVLLLTGRSSHEHKLEGLRSGADAYIAKPFSVEELEIRVQRLIDLRKVLRKVYAGQAPEEAEKSDTPQDPFLVSLREWLEANLENEALEVDQICQAMGISRTQLHRKLKQTLGIPATRYLRKIRMEKALELLRQGNLNVSEVAFRVGFNSLSYFTRCFTEDMGEAPSAFAKRNP